MDVMFVVDVSGSQTEFYQRHLGIILDLLGMIHISPTTSRIALLTFSKSPLIQFSFDTIKQDREVILRRVNNLQLEGGPTNTSAAVQLGLEELRRAGRRSATPVFILLNDGLSNNEWPVVISTSRKLRNAVKEIFVLTLNNNRDNNELIQYAGRRDRIFDRAELDSFLPTFQEFMHKDCPDADPLSSSISAGRPTPLTDLRPQFKIRNPSSSSDGGDDQIGPSCDKSNIAIVLDASGSVDTVFQEQKVVVRKFIENLPQVGTSNLVSIVLYSDAVHFDEELRFDEYATKEQVLDRLDRMQSKGGATATPRALEEALTQLEKSHRLDSKSVLLLFNDGHSQAHWDKVKSVAEKVRDSGVDLFVMALSPDIYFEELERYVQRRSERIFRRGQDQRFLDRVYQEIRAGNCLRQVVPVDVTVVKKNLDLCSANIHLTIVLDSSGSVSDVFRNHVELAKKVADLLMSDDRSRVSVSIISYSQDSAVDVSREYSKASLLQILHNIPFIGAETNTVGAIKLLLEGQKSSNVNSEGVIEAVLLMMDGNSQNSFAMTEETAEELHQTVDEVFVVSLSSQTDDRELNIYAGSPNRVYKTGQEEILLNDLKAELCVERREEVYVFPETQTLRPVQPNFQIDQGCGPNGPLDLVIILDISFSMYEVYEHHRDLAYKLVESMEDFTDVAVSLIKFQYIPTRLLSLEDRTDKDSVLRMINTVKNTGGETRTVGAMKLALEELVSHGREGAQQMIVLFSDGHSQNTMEEVGMTSEAIRTQTKATVFCVTYSEDASLEELRVYAREDGHVYRQNSASQLMEDVRTARTGGSSADCLPSPTPQPTPVIAPKLDICTPLSLDLVLILDASGSVEAVFNRQRGFAGRIVKSLYPLTAETADLQFRVSVISFSDGPQMEYNMTNIEGDREGILSSIRRVSFVGQNTNTASAVRLAVSELRNTRREGVPQIVVMLNDGHSQDAWDVVKEHAYLLRNETSSVYAVSYSPEIYFPELILYTGSENRVYDKDGAEQFIYDLQKLFTDKSCSRTVKEEPTSPLPTIVSPRPPVVSQKNCQPLDVFMVIDTSGSVKDTFERQRTLAISFLEALPADSRIGVSVLKFSGAETMSDRANSLSVPLQDKISRGDLRKFLNELRFTGGSTSLAKAMERTLQGIRNGQNDPNRKAIIAIFSDGKSEDSAQSIQATGLAVRKTGATVLAASFSQFISEDELIHYTGSKQSVFLRENATNILIELSPLRRCQSALVVSPLLYPRCKLDIIFAIDTSMDAQETYQEQIMNAREILNGVQVSSHGLRVGVVSFGKIPKMVHSLRDYQTNSLINAKLNRVKYTGDEGSVIDGLRIANGELLALNRPDTASIIILLSNGNSADSWESVRGLRREMEYSGVHVFAFSAAEDLVSEREMMEYVSEGRNLFVGKHEFASLKNTVVSLHQASPVCPKNRQPIVTPSPTKATPQPKPVIDFKKDCSKTGVDVVFVMDSSSNAKAHFAQQNLVALDLIEQIREDTPSSSVSVGVVTYGGAPVLESPLSSSTVRVGDRIRQMTYRGERAGMASAIQMALNLLRLTDNRHTKIVVLFAHGDSADSLTTIQHTADSLHTVSDQVFVVNFASAINLRTNELELHAGRLENVFDSVQITDGSAAAVVSNYVSQHFCLPPRNRQPVAVKKSGCSKNMDLMIVLDASGSVTENFHRQKEVAMDLVRQLMYGRENDVAVSIVAYSDVPVKVLSMSTGYSGDKVAEMIGSIPFVGGNTATADAVTTAMDDLQLHRRQDAVGVLFLLHDGHSQDAWAVVEQIAQTLDNADNVERFAMGVSQELYPAELNMYAGGSSRVYREREEDQLTRDMMSLFGSGCGFKRELPPLTVKVSPVTTPLPTRPTTTTTRRTTTTTRRPITTSTRAPTTTTRFRTRPTPPWSTKVQTRGTTAQPAPCRHNLDVIFVLDNSGSINEVFERQKTIALDLLGMLPLPPESNHVRVGIIEYSSTPKRRLSLGDKQNRTRALNALSGIQFVGGDTATALAVDDAIQMIKRNDRPLTKTVLILLNDGHSQDNWHTVEAAGKRLRNHVDEVFCVALADDIYLPELRLYSGAENRVYQKTTVSGFVRQISTILTDVAACGIAKRRGEPYVSRPSYTAALTAQRNSLRLVPLQKDCGVADVLFLIDSSGSVGNGGLQKAKSLFIGALHRLPISMTATRVALAKFGGQGKSRLVFPFDTFDRKSELRSAINSIQTSSGVTRMDEALRLAESVFQSSALGNRGPSARRIVLLATDGYSMNSGRTAAQRLRSAGIHLLTVGIPSTKNGNVNRDGLLELSSGQNDDVFMEDTEKWKLYEVLHSLTTSHQSDC